MADDRKTEPIPFPVEVTVNGVKVTVTLMTREDRPQGET
jgi:hypothetical protein